MLHREFRLNNEWRFRGDWELTDSQIFRYRIGLVLSILFVVALLGYILYWIFISFHLNKEIDPLAVFYWIFISYYCLAVLYPCRLVFSSFFYNFKFIGLECGVISTVSLLGKLLMEERYNWAYLAPYCIAVIMTFVAFFTARMRFRST